MEYNTETKEFTYSLAERLTVAGLFTYLVLAVLALALPGSVLQTVTYVVTVIAVAVLLVVFLIKMGEIVIRGKSK